MPVWRNGVIPHCGGLCFGAFRGCGTEEFSLDFAARKQALPENDLPDMHAPLLGDGRPCRNGWSGRDNHVRSAFFRTWDMVPVAPLFRGGKRCGRDGGGGIAGLLLLPLRPEGGEPRSGLPPPGGAGGRLGLARRPLWDKKERSLPLWEPPLFSCGVGDDARHQSLTLYIT